MDSENKSSDEILAELVKQIRELREMLEPLRELIPLIPSFLPILRARAFFARGRAS